MFSLSLPTLHFFRLVLFLTILAIVRAAAQNDVSTASSGGFPGQSLFHGTDTETVQTNNGNLHVEIPIWKAPGRGLSLGFSLIYDNKGWYLRRTCVPDGAGGKICTDHVTKGGNAQQWRILGPFDVFETHNATPTTGGCAGFTVFNNFQIYDPRNTPHHLLPDLNPGSVCSSNQYIGPYVADDGSGWTLPDYRVHKIVSKDGTIYDYNYNPNNQWPGPGILVQDS